MTDEQKARNAENLRKAREARAANAAGVAEAPRQVAVKEVQCVHCGVRFEPDLIERHRVLVHGETAGDIPEGPDNVPPGTIIRPEKGLPYKKRWTKAALEALCNDESVPDFYWVNHLASRSTPVTWNGVPYYVAGGEEQRIPNVIAAILRDSERDTARAVRDVGITDTDGTGAKRLQVFRQPV